MCPPLVAPDSVTFIVDDVDCSYRQVELVQELQRPRIGPSFERAGPDWRLCFARPAVDRLEYLFRVVDRAGGEALVVDPRNPLQARGPFGNKSVIEWPEYLPPTWLKNGSAGAASSSHAVESKALRTTLHMRLWSILDAAPDEPLPLLVVHDGPEYDEFSRLTTFLYGKCESGALPPMRVALLSPTSRDHTYSASANYARALAHELLPWLHRNAPTPQGREARVGMGASLGALAMLHAHRTNPATFGSLFLQSGSYFRQRFDKQESEFVRFRRISRFVGQVLGDREWPHPIAVGMTCGGAEENLGNNLAIADSLKGQGYQVSFAEHRDAHNWTSWRDTLEPHLLNLLAGVWT